MSLRARALLSIAAVIGLAACASVWGFEDAVDRPADGGLEGSADDGAPVATGEVVASDVPGVMCAPRAPEGWQGPLSIFAAKATPLPAVPSCLERYEVAFDGNGEPNAPAGACTCACDPTGTTTPCAGPVLNFFSDDACTTPCGPPNQIVPTRTTACFAFDDGTCPTARWAKAIDAKPGGTCTASTKGTPPPVTWGSEVRLCAPKKDVVARCDADKSPAPTTALPYEPSNYCIASLSATECPSTYPRKRLYFDPVQVTDTRTCKACSCGAPTGTCGGVVRTVDNPGGCSGGEKLVPLSATCSAVKDSNTGYAYEPSDAGAGPVSCPPSGGGADGKFEATAPITVCCRL